MTKLEDASASTEPYDAKTLAKKHRIDISEAEKIIAAHGSDRKASDKAARRVAA